ncbi:MAG: hypothetical protein D6806_05180 [Deltaproteobacteria bacterium]|nr:MAG: hypothetical protein D6806_05180 [Deltaproteobacteria bacterium]
MPQLKRLPVHPEQLVAVIESVNTPMVAAEGRPLEPTKAYILGVRNQDGTFSIYIYLHLQQSNQCLIYLHQPPAVTLENYQNTELEALQFVESMGFIVDNLNYAALSQEQRQDVLARLPVFTENLAAFTGAEGAGQQQPEDSQEQILELEPIEQAEERQEPSLSNFDAARLARLFSSF